METHLDKKSVLLVRRRETVQKLADAGLKLSLLCQMRPILFGQLLLFLQQRQA